MWFYSKIIWEFLDFLIFRRSISKLRKIVVFSEINFRKHEMYIFLKSANEILPGFLCVLGIFSKFERWNFIQTITSRWKWSIAEKEVSSLRYFLFQKSDHGKNQCFVCTSKNCAQIFLFAVEKNSQKKGRREENFRIFQEIPRILFRTVLFLKIIDFRFERQWHIKPS